MAPDRLPLLAFACMMLVPVVSGADSWRFKRGIHKSSTSFGDIRFVSAVDARENQLFPPMWIDMYEKRALITRIRGIHVAQVLSSDNGQAFVVLSNSGMAPLAAIVMGRNGQVLNLVAHGDGIAYCGYSVVLERDWYDGKDPDPIFEFEGMSLQSLSIRACDGSRVTLYGSLLAPDTSPERARVE